MTPTEIALVQESFKKVAPIRDKAAELFYGKLFELDSSLQALFKPDMADQRTKLMSTIGFAVANLNGLDALVPVVEKLGRDHVRFGVKAAHYDPVGTTLL
jgi:hemoglobin-like flavoprotein